MESPIDLTPLISISKDDENCVNNRLYLTSQTPSFSYFFLVKDELPEQGYFYALINLKIILLYFISFSIILKIKC